MPEKESFAQRVLNWFRYLGRPSLEQADPSASLDEFDKMASRVDALDVTKDDRFPICLLGAAGVGKSTLINTLVADTEFVVPAGGGTGPLTANALRVVQGEHKAFAVRYHGKAPLNQARFILEAELTRNTKKSEQEQPQEEEARPDDSGLELDSDSERSVKLRDAISRACLLIAGAQSEHRELAYLVDALRFILGQELKHKTSFQEDDQARMEMLQEVMKNGDAGGEYQSVIDEENPAEFKQSLREHSCGFLAPMIQEMTIHWPSALLENQLEIVDLPGIGILSDVYESTTTEYLRNRAKAVMLVVDSRGVRREDADLLKTSGFLNRLLHASDDLTADPVALIVATVKIDSVAEENWRSDKDRHGKALKNKAAHFAEVAENTRRDITERLKQYLEETWQDHEGGISDAKRDVIKGLLDGLQVFPVSALQYRLNLEDDPDEGIPFISDLEATNIPALKAAIAEVARSCQEEKRRRHEEAGKLFLGQVRARLEILGAQMSEQNHVEEQVEEFKNDLEAFIAPLQREFDNRRGAFRNFLRKTVPERIELKVGNASNKAQREIRGYLRELEDAHWKTLQAAVRREGTFYGSRHINLPHDFSLTFEAPVAEVWSRGILQDVRKETQDFAQYQSEAVNKILDWARNQGFRTTKLLEALVDAVEQHRKQVNAVGKEAVRELREKVRSELIKKIEKPIRNRCKKFVEDGNNAGPGVKNRILHLFEDLAQAVVDAASAPASSLLVQRFKEVDQEIAEAFREHSEPLSEAAETLTKRKTKQVVSQDKDLDGVRDTISKALIGLSDLNEEVEAVSAT